MQGSDFNVQGSDFNVQGSDFNVQGSDGLINFEIARFLRALVGAGSFLLYDLDAARAGRFAAELGQGLGVEAAVAGSSA